MIGQGVDCPRCRFDDLYFLHSVFFPRQARTRIRWVARAPLHDRFCPVALKHGEARESKADHVARILAHRTERSRQAAEREAAEARLLAAIFACELVTQEPAQ